MHEVLFRMRSLLRIRDPNWPAWQMDDWESGATIYRQILDDVADGVYFVDTSRRITFWNRSAEAISGYPAKEVVGRSCENILAHTDGAGCRLCLGGCSLQTTLDDKVNRHTDIFLKHRRGHRIPVSARIAPMLDSEGRVVGGVEVFSEKPPPLEATVQSTALAETLINAARPRSAGKVPNETDEQHRGSYFNFCGITFRVGGGKSLTLLRTARTTDGITTGSRHS